MTPAHERKAKERKARKEAGFVRIEAWVPAAVAPHMRDFIKHRVELYNLCQPAKMIDLPQQEPTS